MLRVTAMLAQNGEVGLGSGLLALLALAIVGLILRSRPDPKITFLLGLLRGLPK